MTTPLRASPQHSFPSKLPEQAAQLASASLAPSTKRAYAGALHRLQQWLDRHQQPLTEYALSNYLTELFEYEMKSPATCSLVVASVECQAKLTETASPIGRRTHAVLGGIRRQGRERGRGQNDALTYEHVIKILTTCQQPRKLNKKRESVSGTRRRGLVDGALVSLAFMAGLRRSEIAELEWRDLTPGTEDEHLVVKVRSSKTDHEGKSPDYRLLKGDCATALDELRTYREEHGPVNETEKVIGLNGQNINRRIQAACRAAGLQSEKLTAHSGRIGLASELTQRGAEITETALAGGWKSTAMVIYYSRRAKVQRGAVARYF